MHVGILGGGNISSTHALAAAAAGCRVAAVWGQNTDKVAAIARAHGAPSFAELERFLAHRPMDLVAIGSPSGLHATHVSLAAHHGLHVLVEKPLDISVARADEAIAAARRAGVRLGVFFQDRLKPDLLKVKRLIDAGRLGRAVLVSARVKWYRPPAYYATSKWRGTSALDGGGALINQGIHTLDSLLWLLGDVRAVTAARATLVHDIEVEDTLVATLQFATGALATFEATTAAYPGYPRRLEITGTEGTLIVDGDHLAAVDLRAGADAIAPSPPSDQRSHSSPVVSDIDAHRRVFEDFVDAIRANREPACNGEEGRRSVALVEAIYEAALRSTGP